MQLFRRHLSWVVCGWLACQLSGVVATPLVLWHAVASTDDRDCDCPIAPGQACPMHHNGKHDDATCRMRNAFPASDAALFSQSGVFGILPAPTATVTVFHPGSVVRTPTSVAVARAHVPEAPPPRA
jgi:hypothetical protein